ncbi:MAG: hypothetical protein STSR0004_20970 [Peptococcaceae bacterium]
MLKVIEEQIFEAKKNGLSDQEIGEKFKVNLRYIEKIITKRLGVNVSIPLAKKKINTLQPKNFSLEETTVWSFKSRGNWATHNGNYRGNWSPYIPRNVILKYSKEGELVLDCFCGAGTTGVECKLTNRNFVGIDINPKAIELAKENIDFPIDKAVPPKVDFKVGDARELSGIGDETIDLICTHPPYADIIHYTDNQKQDLSFCASDVFLDEMYKIAKENYRVLKQGGYCAVLIGDMRKNKCVIPLGFWLIDIYLKAGFLLKDIVIKRQHNCKTTGFWYQNSIRYNFLLLAHEYLAIFKKDSVISDIQPLSKTREIKENSFKPTEIEQQEANTVWIFNAKDWYNRTIQNLIKRYDGEDYCIIDDFNKLNNISKSRRLIIVGCTTIDDFERFCKAVNEIVKNIKNKGFLAIICHDVRLENGTITPLGIKIEKYLNLKKELKIKEIVVISLENNDCKIGMGAELNISHKYLVIYSVEKGDKK